MKPTISVAINTLNEEKNIGYALRSVRAWADEIVVVDMHSDDRTAEIAREFGARVFLHERLGFADPARAFAIEKTTSSWVFILDADELVPAALGKRLVEIAEQGEYDIVTIHRINYLLGSRLHHTGWGIDSDYHQRFFRRGSLVATATIHDFLKPVPGARILRLPAEEDLAIVHFNYLDVSHFLAKLNRYTTIEAEQAASRAEESTPLASAWTATREFYRRYVVQRGYRDGWRGFYLSAFMAFYRLSVAAKLIERKKGFGPEAVAKLYALTAERLLAEYGASGAPPAAAASASAKGEQEESVDGSRRNIG
jgi:glycosyltransferase involved in cell wall biosynthesis